MLKKYTTEEILKMGEAGLIGLVDEKIPMCLYMNVNTGAVCSFERWAEGGVFGNVTPDLKEVYWKNDNWEMVKK